MLFGSVYDDASIIKLNTKAIAYLFTAWLLKGFEKYTTRQIHFEFNYHLLFTQETKEKNVEEHLLKGQSTFLYIPNISLSYWTYQNILRLRQGWYMHICGTFKVLSDMFEAGTCMPHI